MKTTTRALMICTAVVCVSGSTASAVIADDSGDPSIVAVRGGRLRGLVSDHREFRGVPFAAPPLADLRFRPPQEVARWNGVRDATQFSGSCPQGADVGVPSTNEDCLYLNVYTPLSAHHLPVMVWIHGGGFTTGAGYPFVGTTMVAKGDVIVVTINYRLGPLGFLSIPGLATESHRGASGDYGIMDQQAALRWVKTNIDKFGGDANNVTIFGQSAGGGSVSAHLASPTSAGLFAQAIIESGPANADTQAVSYQKGEAIVAAAGCSNTTPAAEVACMRALPVSEILAVEGGGASLTIDGLTLKAAPHDAITSGKFNRVPVIQGCNQWEGRIMAYPAFDLSGNPLTPELYATTIQNQFGPAANSVLAEYPVANYPTPVEAFSAVLGDSIFACPTRTQIRALSTRGVPVYAYEFTEPNPPLPLPVPLGPTHSSEILFVFQDAIGFATPSQFTGNQLGLSNQMLSYWTDFAHRANPNRSSLPRWTEYRNASDAFIDLTTVSPGPSMFTTFSDEHHCGFWATQGL